MSDQTAEEQTEIVDNGEPINGESTEAAEVEIVLEGADASPEPVPQWVNKRFGRYAKQVKKANSETDGIRRELETVRKENELFRLNAQQGQAKEPKSDDFDDDDEYRKAIRTWDRAEIARENQTAIDTALQATQTQNTQVQYSDNIDTKIDSHYERVATLKMPNYSELEGNVQEDLGDDICREILANSDESHLVIGHLGANRTLALKYKSMIENGQPVKAMLEIGKLGARLSVKPKTQLTPDPETKLAPGESTSASTNKLDKLRKEAAKTGDLTKLMDYKKSLRLGVTS